MVGISDGGIGTENIRGNNIIALSLPANVRGTPIYGITVGIITLSGSSVYNISQNKISGILSTGPADIRGMTIAPSTNSTVNIYNNFVSITNDNAAASIIFGIRLGYAVGRNYTTNLYYNSVRIGGTQAATNKAPAYGINKADQNGGSVYNQRNNIATMERSGGYPDTARFVGFLLSSTAGTNTCNYNTYYASDAINGFAAGGWDGNLYRNTALTSYKTGAVTQEQNSNFANVTFVSNIDLHLSAPSSTAATLYGTLLPALLRISTEIAVLLPTLFQGADEPANILPVQALSLNGEKNETYNVLHWQTVSEIKNRGFYLERSVNLQSYTSLVFVPSKAVNGNSTVALNYSFDDLAPLSGKGFYRLKQVDFDGTVTYSNVVTLAGKAPLNFSIVSVYPNPVVTSLKLFVKTPNNAKASLVIIDAAGKVVLRQNNDLTIGDNHLSVNTAKLSSGMYSISLINLTTNEAVNTRFTK